MILCIAVPVATAEKCNCAPPPPPLNASAIMFETNVSLVMTARILRDRQGLRLEPSPSTTKHLGRSAKASVPTHPRPSLSFEKACVTAEAKSTHIFPPPPCTMLSSFSPNPHAQTSSLRPPEKLISPLFITDVIIRGGTYLSVSYCDLLFLKDLKHALRRPELRRPQLQLPASPTRPTDKRHKGHQTQTSVSL